MFGKFCVPPALLSVIKSFHDGMKASVVVGDNCSNSFLVQNGVRQGCTTVCFTFFVLRWIIGGVSALRLA